MKIRFQVATLLSAAVLAACAAGTDAIIQTAQYAFSGGSSAENARLNPNFRYLRATIDGRVAFLALGYEENHPQGPVEVWFSAQKAVLRLQNGRLVGVVGVTTEWRNVLLPTLPSWSVLAHADKPTRWVRVRDVMPGYRFGIKDALELRVVSPPSRSALRGRDASSLTWFEERVYADASDRSPDTGKPVRPSVYAVEFREGRETVVYSEQCIAADLCFAWQRWSAASQSPKDTR